MSHRCTRHFWDRREFLFRSGGGISGVALAYLLDRQGLLSAGAADGLAWSGERIERIETPRASPLNVNGAGDALIGATLARISRGDDFFQAARIGMAAAALTVETQTTVRQDISMASVLARFERARSERADTSLESTGQAKA